MLQVQKISKMFGGLKAVDQVSFDIKKGSIKALIGPNGAGKTTMFNIISGNFAPTEGQVIFEDRAITGRKPHQIAHYGIIRTFQGVKMFDSNGFTVLDNLLVGYDKRFQAGMLRSSIRSMISRKEEQEALEEAHRVGGQIGLSDWLHAPASELPCGYQRLLELARALMAKPRLLLLDEPAAGLNDSETKRLVGVLREIRQMGITILLVEHHMGLVMEVSDDIVVMNNGKKIAEGSPEDINRNRDVIQAYMGEEDISA
ncbi:ABC transporter ATP-binding protein [Paenibacillus naphthalenovorans]|uniref:ABC transporter ATP-binding protein n=1 Tax=Paenibacillus naphthalenovorans TaxID=162209 RepID=UPI003D28F56B